MRMITPRRHVRYQGCLILTVELPCLHGCTGYLSPKDAKAMRRRELEDVCFEIILILSHEG